MVGSNFILGFLIKLLPMTELVLFCQVIIEFCIMTLIILLSARLLKKSYIEFGNKLKFFKDIGNYYFKMVFYMIITNIIISFFTIKETSTNQEIIEIIAADNKFYIFFSVVIFAPIVEELVFRGALYNAMKKKFSVKFSIIASSSVFALMHFTISLILGDFSDMIFLPGYIVPAIILCTLYEKTRNIYAPIFLHFINNLIGTILIFNT